jgi:hypothetical protein
MATAKNDITGDSIITKKPSDAYRDNWDKIFGKKSEEIKEVKEEKSETKVNKPKRK